MQPIETIGFPSVITRGSLQGVGQCSPLKPVPFGESTLYKQVYRELGNAAH